MPNPIDNSFINTQFKTFVDFARGKDAGTKVRALIGNNGPERTIGAKSESVLNKIFFRLPSNKAVNNEVRTIFRASVARMFGGEEHIPASVKSAMKLGDYGKGRPLTAHRILAVQSALEQIAAKHDTLLQRGLAYYGDRHGPGGYANLVKLAFASCHGNPDAMDIVDNTSFRSSKPAAGSPAANRTSRSASRACSRTWRSSRPSPARTPPSTWRARKCSCWAASRCRARSSPASCRPPTARR